MADGQPLFARMYFEWDLSLRQDSTAARLPSSKKPLACGYMMGPALASPMQKDIVITSFPRKLSLVQSLHIGSRL